MWWQMTDGTSMSPSEMVLYLERWNFCNFVFGEVSLLQICIWRGETFANFVFRDGVLFNWGGASCWTVYIHTPNLQLRQLSLKWCAWWAFWCFNVFNVFNVLPGEHIEHPGEQNWKPPNSECSQRWILWSILTEVKPRMKT